MDTMPIPIQYWYTVRQKAPHASVGQFHLHLFLFLPVFVFSLDTGNECGKAGPLLNE